MKRIHLLEVVWAQMHTTGHATMVCYLPYMEAVLPSFTGVHAKHSGEIQLTNFQP